MSVNDIYDFTDEKIAETYDRVLQFFRNELYTGLGFSVKQEAWSLDTNNDFVLNARFVGDPWFMMDANGDVSPRAVTFAISDGNLIPSGI